MNQQRRPIKTNTDDVLSARESVSVSSSQFEANRPLKKQRASEELVSQVSGILVLKRFKANYRKAFPEDTTQLWRQHGPSNQISNCALWRNATLHFTATVRTIKEASRQVKAITITSHSTTRICNLMGPFRRSTSQCEERAAQLKAWLPSEENKDVDMAAFGRGGCC